MKFDFSLSHLVKSEEDSFKIRSKGGRTCDIRVQPNSTLRKEILRSESTTAYRLVDQSKRVEAVHS